MYSTVSYPRLMFRPPLFSSVGFLERICVCLWGTVGWGWGVERGVTAGVVASLQSI